MITPLRFLAIAALFALSACSDLTSVKPLGGSSSVHADPHLIGVWRLTTNTESGQAGYLFVSPRKEGDSLHAVFIGWSASQPTERMEFDVTTGVAGSTSFVNLKNLVASNNSIGKEPPGYLPFLYRFGPDGSLLIYDHSDAGLKLVEDAIKKHRLSGTVKIEQVVSGSKKTSSGVTEVDLTSDQRTIDAFFAANAKAIFTDSVETFQPVKQP